MKTNQVLIAGGVTDINEDEGLRTIVLIDIGQRTVSHGGDMLESRYKFHLIVMEEWEGIRVLAIGGVGRASTEEYSVASQQWQEADSLAEPKESYGAVAVPRLSVCEPWNRWGSWGPCSQTCYIEGQETNGVKVRTRICGVNSTELCIGDSRASEPCFPPSECGGQIQL